MAIPGKRARIRVMSDAEPIPFTDEATGTVDDVVYSVGDRVKRYWDPATQVVVKVDGDVVAVSEYRVQHAGGRIHFRSEQSGPVTVSGAYITVTTAVEVREYTFTINSEVIDRTWLNPDLDGFRERMAGIVDATGTLSGFYNVNNLLTDKILAQKPTVIEMQPSADMDEMFAVYAFLESDELQAAVEGAVETNVGWQSTGDILVEQTD